MPTKSPSTPFPDQGRKLRFLLDEWGDRRETDPRRLTHVLQAEQDGRIKSVPRIQTQAALAQAIREESARVNVWVQGHRRVPAPALVAICRIYAVDERAFRILPFDDFVVVLSTGIVWPAWSRWRGLLAAATLPGLRQTTRDPAIAWTDAVGASDLRFPYVPSADGQPALPEIAAETPFWLALSSPQGEADDDAWTWTGWHVLILSRDGRTDWFAHLAPVSPAAGTFPNARTLYLPAGPGLRHRADDLGAFESIAVLTRAPFPEDIVAGLSAGNGQGLLIEPALHQLAVWLVAAKQDAAVRLVRYRVMPARHRVEPQASPSPSMTAGTA